jgi:hypothetical protein
LWFALMAAVWFNFRPIIAGNEVVQFLIRIDE